MRLDAGYYAGDTVSQYYDNLIAKLIVWGDTREKARRRLLRAIEETVIEGVATTLPADVAILEHDDFVNGVHSTKWVEETLDLSSLSVSVHAGESSSELVRRDVTAEVGGKRVSVSLWLPEGQGSISSPAATTTNRPKRTAGSKSSSGGSGQVAVPMQGTIVKVVVEVGATVSAGDSIVILEAMKMENAVNADKDGVIKEIRVAPGDAVAAGDIVAVIE